MANHVTREAELFDILVDLLADKKLERNALRVLVGTRGFELGRPYMHLCQQGLIAEETVRPGFLRRLFGARATLWVRVTEQGLRAAAKARGAEVETAAPPEEQNLVTEPMPVTERVAEAPAALPELAEAPSPIVVAEPTVEPEITPPPVAFEVVAELPVAPPTAEAEAEAEAVPAPQPKPAPKEKAAPPRRFAVTDFTDTLGGTPFDSAFQAPSSDRLDDLTENLGLLGFEITEAGKLLAVNRWAQDGTDPEVALEVITTALAHAARLSASGTAALDQDIALALAHRIQDSFAIFVSEGLLDAEHLTHWAEQMARFLTEPVETSGLEAYLLDPWRGIAPPAVCPEEIYLPNEVEAD